MGAGAIGHLVGGYFAKSKAFGLSLVGIVATGGQGCGGQGTCAKGFEKLSSIHEVIFFVIGVLKSDSAVDWQRY